MVSIIAPVNSPSEVKPLVSAGADELYCGLIDAAWNRKYSPVCAPNRREWRQANLTSFRGLAKVVEKAHASSVPVSLALNAPYFAQSQEKDLIAYVRKAVSCGVDSFMVADVGAFLLLAELDLDVELYASSVAGAYNSKAVSFYRKLGAGRVILPRHLSLPEIRSIVKSHPGFEFEVFALFNRCLHADDACTFLHGDECFGLGENACTMAYDIRAQAGEKKAPGKIRRLDRAYHTKEGVTQALAFQCGLCALYDLAKWGVYGVKIVERVKPLWMKIYGVKAIGNLLRHIEEDAPSRWEFVRDVRRIVENTVYSDVKRPCTDLNCFYPEEFL